MASRKKKTPFEIFHEISLHMNSTMDSHRLLEIILDSCIDFTQATTGSIILVNKKKKVLDIMVERGLGKDVEHEVKLKLGKGITGWSAKHNKSVLLGDVSKDKRYVRVKDYLMSELVVPLTVEDEVIGVISVDSDRKDAFTKEHLSLMQLVATQAAQVIKNARAYESLKQQNERLQTLLNISEVLSGTIEPEDCFTEILNVVNKHLRMRRGTLVLYEPKTDELVIKASAGLSGEEEARGRYKPGEGITGEVFQSGKPVALMDITEDPRFLDRTGARRKVAISKRKKVSFFCVPIRLQKRIIGVLSVDKTFQSEEQFYIDLDFLSIVAAYFAQVLHIQQLLTERHQVLIQENINLRQQLKDQFRHENIIGESRPMQKVFDQMDMVAHTQAPILILGESGTGKELVARAIHNMSPRAPKPFVAINCAAIPENLLESELFGYVRGAFTGAFSDKKGFFQFADGGTIFLDEIIEMSPSLQAKLLRVLQEREISPLGSPQTIKVDVRVIAATNKDPVEQIKNRLFREDLYYRLNVVEIKLPALRERKDDIPILIAYFIRRYNEQYGKDVTQITPEALRLLTEHLWDGNVRELQNYVERAVLMTRDDVIDIDILPATVLQGAQKEVAETSPAMAATGAIPLSEDVIRDTLNDFFTWRIREENRILREEPAVAKSRLWQDLIRPIERMLVSATLDVTGHNKSRAASLLGIDRNTLRAKLK
jgi:Nif-specific regulatory protein